MWSTWFSAQASVCSTTTSLKTAGRLLSKRSIRRRRFSRACSPAMPVACRERPMAERARLLIRTTTPRMRCTSTGGVQYAWHKHWTMSADYVHEQGVHGYRRYEYTAGYTLFSPLFPQDPDTQMANVPNFSVFKADNRSRYNAMLLHRSGQRLSPLQLDRQLCALEREDVGLRSRRSCLTTSMVSATRCNPFAYRRLRPIRRRCHQPLVRSPASFTSPAAFEVSHADPGRKRAALSR